MKNIIPHTIGSQMGIVMKIQLFTDQSAIGVAPG